MRMFNPMLIGLSEAECHECLEHLLWFGSSAEFIIVVIQALPILLACIFLTKYLFQSCEGIDGALNG